MQIILLHDVRKIGRRHDVKEVSDGYAANYLIPNGLATRATPEGIAALEAKKARAADAAAAHSSKLRSELTQITGKTVHIVANANEQGHLFQGLRAGDIAAALKKEYGVDFPEDAIGFSGPIKETGEHKLTVSVDGERAALTLAVVGA